MKEPLLEPRLVHMPRLAPGEWLNATQPLTDAALRGQVLLIDFWDYTCINCLRTLPYLRQWYRRYADLGLTIIGIHAPEFKFASHRREIEKAINELEIPYPVLLDSGYENWTRFANRAWPTKYLVDSDGYIRLRRQGEGYYEETELAVQQLLLARDQQLTLPEPLPPLRSEDEPGAVCYRPTPELHAGYRGGGLFGGTLGNPEGYVPDALMAYEIPDEEQLVEGQFFVEGFWRAEPESLAYAGRNSGRVIVPYRAAGVNAVLSPSSDPVELMLDLRPGEEEPLVELQQDGASLTPMNAGADVHFDGEGRSFVRVTRPRLYQLVQNHSFDHHRLDLFFRAPALALYTITFNTCLAADGPAGNGDTFRRN